MTYILNVNVKTKSTLYEKERLHLVADSHSIKGLELSIIVSQLLRHDPETYGLTSDNRWVLLDKLVNSIRESRIEWENLQYYDILRMIDNSDSKRYEIRTERIGSEYKNNFKWYIRVILPTKPQQQK